MQSSNSDILLFFSHQNDRLIVSACKGITTIELMITILVAAILAAIAVPSMGSFINKTRLSGNVNEFIAATMLARSEAVQRAGAVTICRSSGAETGSDSCNKANGDWSTGWLIYVGTAADSPNSAGHQVLARQGAFATGASIAAASGATAITYAASGAPWPAPPGSFTFTFNNEFLRKVCFSPSGRVSSLPAGAEGCPA
ncbi:type II transport GspH family protein [Collimonas arenae]|nr:type II transport GspH family protein [Collimonas arenae]